MFKLRRNVLVSLLFGTVASLALDNGRAAPVVASPANGTNMPGPRIQFADPIYDFGRAQAGDLVKYTFIYTNTGDQTLEVTAVQPSCGCTTAGDWTRKAAPGETGKVAIQFNSANFNGPVLKTISVTSNDKQRPVTVLQLKGTVWKPIELVPQYTVINVPPDATSASATIRILNHTDDPLAIHSLECTTKSFSVALVTNQPGKEYTVTLHSATELNIGNIQGKVMAKTSSTKTPTLEIPFWVNVQPVITVAPPRISLPQTPLKAKAPATLTIQNNSTNALALHDATANVPGVDVVLKEVQAGRLFSAVVTFPEGYETPIGKPVEIVIKSNQPRMPEVKVPVISFPRPMATAPTPAPVSKPAGSNPPPPAPKAIR
jgi:hypothetical protein